MFRSTTIIRELVAEPG